MFAAVLAALLMIATNLVTDHRRRPMSRLETSFEPVESDTDSRAPRVDEDVAERTARRIDLARAMDRLKPRERDLLWLAYAHGSSHEEIATTLGLKTNSIKRLLFRARRRLASLLQNAGTPSQETRRDR